MAGSPAAGKTELLDLLIEENRITNIVRIDATTFAGGFPTTMKQTLRHIRNRHRRWLNSCIAMPFGTDIR